VTVVVVVVCTRRGVVVDGLVVTVDAVMLSFVESGGEIELISSVGESVVGVCRRVLRRTETVLREDCGVLSLAGWRCVWLFLEDPEVGVEVLRVVEPEGRVLPRDERLVMWVWAEDHMSLSVRGDLAFLVREVG
jgi:hypothetical protein